MGTGLLNMHNSTSKTNMYASMLLVARNPVDIGSYQATIKS